MNRNYVYKALTLAILLATLLAACGTTTAETPTEQPAAPEATGAETTASACKDQTVRVWIVWGDNPAQIQTLFDKFGAATGSTVEVTAPLDEDKILPSLTGSNPPDVLVVSDGSFAKSYAKEGLVDELTPAIQTGGIDLNDMYPAPIGQCKEGDKLWCLPWGSDLYALFWNKELFEAAGLDPEKPPATMEELVEFADKLTIAGADGKITQIGFVPDQPWSHRDLYARMLGGFWYNEDGTELLANSQALIDAMQWEQQFYTKYGVDNVREFTSGFGEYMSPDHPFLAGKVAMMVEGEWQTGPNFISKLKPELNYGVAPFPPPADHPERAGTAVAQGTVALIPSGAANKACSAELLSWMMSPEIVAEEFCYNANLPTSKKAAQDPCFEALGPKFKVFLDLMNNPNATYIITTPIHLEIDDAIGAVEEQVLYEGADIKALLDEVQAELAAKLKEALQP